MVDLKGEVEEIKIRILNDDSRSWIFTLGIVPMLVVLGENMTARNFFSIAQGTGVVVLPLEIYRWTRVVTLSSDRQNLLRYSCTQKTN